MTIRTPAELQTAIDVVRNETLRHGNTKGRIATLFEDVRDSGPFPIANFGPAAIAADAGEGWTTALTLPAPAVNTQVFDYFVRVHGYQVSSPFNWQTDEGILLRVSQNASNAAAVALGGGKPFNSPRLRLTTLGTAVTVDVRADPTEAWSWVLSATRIAAPFDGQAQFRVAAPIGTGSTNRVLLTVYASAKNGGQVEVDYRVRGAFNSSGTTWSFLRQRGMFVIEKSGNLGAVANHVTQWANARVSVSSTGPYCDIKVQQHATEDWIVEAQCTAVAVGG
jgi:hypothetical protein